jgi:NADH:ubiquinone oxidoreductase subunit 5 (subunit L)/multisubunit Na+/H+ antiporter MnhA subunit
MNEFLPYSILIPVLGFVVNLMLPRKREAVIFWSAITTVSLHALCLLVFTFIWIGNGALDIHGEGPVLYQANDNEFSLNFFFDRNTAVYFWVASVLTFLVMIFSRYYMHREPGFKRFFNNVLFFYAGLSCIIFSGNLETLFIGWEIIGITSFFLIAFYRDRYLPVKNALKVVSIYRVADVFLLLGIWICHHQFGQSLSFATWKQMFSDGVPLITEEPYKVIVPLLFLVVALVKSAQLPFSSWLPRAMEGPTTSSAIFYGSLSVHIGVFLLLRTYPLWGDILAVKILIIGFGLSTALVATMIARVQSAIKSQLAYSSIAQIGLMFAEVALGWHTLALVHFAGNAFLRTYQLLVSPSVLSYLIHDQFFNFIPPQHNVKDNFTGRLNMAVYTLSIKEWNLDRIMYKLLWQPLKTAGNMLEFIHLKNVLYFFLPLYAACLYYVIHQDELPVDVLHNLPIGLAFVSVLLILKAFVKRNEAPNAWFLVVMSQLFTAMAIAFNEQFDIFQIFMYLSGIVISTAIGYWVFSRLSRAGESITLDRFHGHSYEYPGLTRLFMLASLGMAGFPITPTFIGEDLILGHVQEHQFGLTLLISLGLILDGLAVFRIYARLFLGPHEKGYHEVVYKSS